MSASSGRPLVEVLNGVNLDQLGNRDPALYGTLTLAELEGMAEQEGHALGLEVRCFQTNHEGAYVERLHAARGAAAGLILNPGAWTHYCWAIRDALEIASLPAVEVHLSDPTQRDSWRQVSVLEGLCFEAVRGRGPDGYRDALALLCERLQGGAA